MTGFCKCDISQRRDKRGRFGKKGKHRCSFYRHLLESYRRMVYQNTMEIHPWLISLPGDQRRKAVRDLTR